MCAFKKPSTPSYGVKLFVSLVLLAISLCLVNCTATATTVPADVARLEIKKTEVVSKLTALVSPIGNKKFSEHNPTYDVKTAFPTSATAVQPAVITPASSSVGGVTPVPTEFKVLLPVDKNIGDYITEVVKPLGGIADKSSTNVNGLIQTELAKDAHKLVPGVRTPDFDVEKNFVQLETILGVNFKFSSSGELEKILPPATGTAPPDAGKVLFDHVFSGATLAFDPIVYVDKTYTDAADFVKKCAGEVTTAARAAATPPPPPSAATATPVSTAPRFSNVAEAIKVFLDHLLSELKPSGTTSTVIELKWSDIEAAIITYGFEDQDEIKLSGKDKFSKSMIVPTNVKAPSSHYDKFYLKVTGLQKINNADENVLFINYLVANLGPSVCTDAATAYPELAKIAFSSTPVSGSKDLFTKATTAPADGDGFHKIVSAKISDLIDAINAKIGDYELLEFVDADIAPASSPFSVDSATSPNLVCPNFPVAKSTSGPATATIAEFEKYVKFVLDKFKAAGDNTKIKAEFLALLWAKTNLDAYEATLTTTATAPATTGATTTTPDATGGKGGAGATGTTGATGTPVATDDANQKGATDETGANSGGENGGEDSNKSGDKQEAQNTGTTSGSTQSGNDYMWIVWAVVAIVAAAIVAAAGYFLWLRKKNASNL